MKRTIDELFIDAAPAAALPAQAALAAQTALAASPPPLQALKKDQVAASPGSETEEEELIDGICTFNGIRATPPRLLFTPTPPDSGGGVPDKFAPLSEVVWQSPPLRDRGGPQAASPYFDKSTSDSAPEWGAPGGVGTPGSLLGEHLNKFVNVCSCLFGVCLW